MGGGGIIADTAPLYYATVHTCSAPLLSVLRYIHRDTAILCTDRHARRTPDCLIDSLNTLRAPVPRIQTRPHFASRISSLYMLDLAVILDY